MNSNDHISVEVAQIALEIFGLSMLITGQGVFTVDCWWSGRPAWLHVRATPVWVEPDPGRAREVRELDFTIYLGRDDTLAYATACRDNLQRFLPEASHA